MSALTIETLETIFTYLGCANIPTIKGMDGAIPLECLMSQSNDVALKFDLKDLHDYNAERTKTVALSNSHLSLYTIQPVHWSTIRDQIRHNLPGSKTRPTEADGFIHLWFSQINSNGAFRKFKLDHAIPMDNHAKIKSIYNPEFLFGYYDGHQSCLSCESETVLRDYKLSQGVGIMCSVRFSIKYYWTVKTRFDEVCPSLTLLTDATGVKELWKLRDIPPGKRRRTALLHWVSDHWRKSRKDPEIEHYVRQHLRGTTELTQQSFSATITPSQCDTLQNELNQAHRDRLKQLKKDRRQRQKQLNKKAHPHAM